MTEHLEKIITLGTMNYIYIDKQGRLIQYFCVQCDEECADVETLKSHYENNTCGVKEYEFKSTNIDEDKQ